MALAGCTEPMRAKISAAVVRERTFMLECLPVKRFYVNSLIIVPTTDSVLLRGALLKFVSSDFFNDCYYCYNKYNNFIES